MRSSVRSEDETERALTVDRSDSLKNQEQTTGTVKFVRGSAEAPRFGTFSTAVWNLGKVVDQIVYLLRRCQNLGAASSNPVQTRQDTIDVDCCVREYKIGERERRKTHFVRLSPYLLVLIGYI